MEQENLLDLFGITTEDFEKKASARTKEKKEKTGTPKQKKGKNKDTYPLPAAIYGCGYCFTASDGGEARASRDRLKELLRGRFLGLDAFSFSLEEAENKEFVILQSLREDDDKDKVLMRRPSVMAIRSCFFMEARLRMPRKHGVRSTRNLEAA